MNSKANAARLRLVIPGAKKILSRYDSFEHLREHVKLGSSANITMCMDKHLLHGGTLDELLELAQKDNERICSGVFLDKPYILRYIEHRQLTNKWLIEANNHGVYRVVGYKGERDPEIDAEHAAQESHWTYAAQKDNSDSSWINGRWRYAVPPLPAELQPTPDFKELEERVAKIRLKGPLVCPTGTTEPRQTRSNAIVYYRDPQVRAWVLQRADGKCELCDRVAPFLTATGEPYLESHHVTMLAERGPDTPNNTTAVCPNCHRELHHGADKAKLKERLLALILGREGSKSRQVEKAQAANRIGRAAEPAGLQRHEPAQVAGQHSVKPSSGSHKNIRLNSFDLLDRSDV